MGSHLAPFSVKKWTLKPNPKKGDFLVAGGRARTPRVGMIRNWSYPSTRHASAQDKPGAAYLKGAAAPPAAGPFNSTLHTGDPILGLNVVLLYFITYALRWWHMVSSCVVVNLFLALRALCLAC